MRGASRIRELEVRVTGPKRRQYGGCGRRAEKHFEQRPEKEGTVNGVNRDIENAACGTAPQAGQEGRLCGPHGDPEVIAENVRSSVAHTVWSSQARVPHFRLATDVSRIYPAFAARAETSGSTKISALARLVSINACKIRDPASSLSSAAILERSALNFSISAGSTPES